MFQGMLVALVTPFRNGAVDGKALADLVEFLIDEGVDGLVPCGTTGEAATLSHTEHTEVVRQVVEVARGRVPVIAGTGSNSTAEAIQLTAEAEAAGADGALLISPYYNKPTPEGLYQHFRTVAEASGLPLILYNVPGRTGSNMLPATVARLAEVERIVGIKEASGSVDQAMDIRALCGDRLTLLSGEDSATLPLMALGARGAISAVANIAPGQMARLTRSCLEGRWDDARRLHYELLPLFRACFVETNPIPVKTALALMGRLREEFRLPLTSLAPENRERLRQTLDRAGLLPGR